MAFFLPRKLLAAALLAALSLPSLAQSEAAAPAAAAPAAASTTEAAAPAARPGPRAQRGGQRMYHRHHHRHMHMMQGEQGPGHWAASWQERRTEHLAQLKGALQLSPAQETAWTEFTTAIEHTPSHARLSAEGLEALTTPERIDRMRALRTQRAAEADQRGDAIKAFYAQLNPAQQKTFDAHHRFARPMGGPAGRAMPASGEGAAQPGWQQHPDNCPMMDGSGPHDGRYYGPRGQRGAPAAK